MSTKTRSNRSRTNNRVTVRNVMGGRYRIFRDGTLVNSNGDQIQPYYSDSKGHWSGTVRLYGEDGTRTTSNIYSLLESTFGHRAAEDFRQTIES